MKKIIISLFSIVLVSCGGGSGSDVNSTIDSQSTNDGSTASTFVGGSNRSTLVGDQLGSGTELNANLVKIIGISTDNIDDFIVGPAYLLRDSRTYFIPIRNIGPARCFIQLKSITFKDNRGSILFTRSEPLTGYASGSVSKDSGSAVCLDRGERGYIHGPTSTNIDDISQITASGISDTLEPGGMPTETWKALSYNIISSTSFMVTVQNTGSIEAKPVLKSLYILFDDKDIPLHYGYLDAANSLTAPNDTTVFMENSFYFDGVASKMEIFINNY